MSQQAAVFIVDPHSIFRLGMTTCLESLPVISSVASADSVAEAWESPELPKADLGIVDVDAPGMREFVGDVRSAYGTLTLASGSGWATEEILGIIEAGAVGVLSKESLTPETLEANVRAALLGAGVLPSELMTRLLGAPGADLGPGGAAAGQLSAREQEVLRLIADGHGTREVAAKLSYSERTIKNVLHDVATKLGARSRSHAVAHALRAGLI